MLHEISTTELNKRRNIFILLLLMSCSQISAQNVQFKKFGNSDGLPSNECYDIHQDDDGYIWVCTDHGVSRFNSVRFDNFDVSTEGISGNTVFTITEIDSLLWFTCYNNTVFNYNKKTNTFKTVLQSNQNALQKSYFKHVYKFGNKILIGSEDGATCIVLDSFNTFHPFISRETSQHSFKNREGSYTLSKKVNKLGILSLGETIRKPLYKKLYSHKNSLFFRSGTDVFKIKKDTLFKLPHKINRISKDEENLFLSTYNGIIVINSVGTKIHVLKGYAITKVIKDFEGNYWATTLNNGILKINQLIKSFSINFLGSSEKIVSIESNTSNLFLGTSHGKIIAVDSNLAYKTKSLRSFYAHVKFFRKEKNRIGLRSSNFDVETLKESNNEMQEGWSCGPYFITIAQSFFTYHSKGSHQLINVPKILSTFKFNDTTIYLGTLKGLFRITPNSIEHPTLVLDPSFRISSITSLDNAIVVGTVGFGTFVIYKNKITPIAPENSNKMVHALEIIDDSTLLIAGNKGIDQIKLKRKKNNINTTYQFTYTSRDKLQSNFIIGLKNWKNKIWYLTNNGLQNFTICETIPYIPLPKIHITNFKANGMSAKNKNALKSTENDINIAFLAISNKASKHIKYRYALSKSNQPFIWNNTKAKEVNYNNLEPGEYKFAVCAQGSKGIWTPLKQVSFIIKPSFWQKKWVQTISLLLIFLIIYLLVHQVMKRKSAKQKEEAIKKELEQKYKEIVNQSLRSQMNPHFVFNALQSIQGYILGNKVEESANYLTKFASLMRQGLEFSSLEFISLKEEVQFLTNYLKVEKMRFPDRFNYSISIDSDLLEEGIKIPPLMIQTFCENATKHGFVTNEKSNLLNVKFSLHHNFITIQIEDNGVGYYNSSTDRISKHNSKGTYLVNERLKFLKQKYGIGSLEIDSNLHVKGTKIKLTLPFE